MDTQTEGSSKNWYVFLPICIGLGTGLGALYGNVGAGIAIGAAIGTLLNLLAYCRLKHNE